MMGWCEWCYSTRSADGKIEHKSTCCLAPVRLPEHSLLSDRHYCSKCRGYYEGNASDHFHKTCVYEVGCPHCHQKYQTHDHVEPCSRRQSWLKEEHPDPSKRGPLELLSYRKSAVASSVEHSGTEARCACDGQNDTRWSSRFTDNEWIMVDLERMCRIDRVILSWEIAYAKAYQLQFSMDAVAWFVVFDTNKGKGGVEVIPLLGIDTFVKRHARFVRLMCSRRGTNWGYSLWSFEILGERVDKVYALKFQEQKPDLSGKTPEEQVLASDWWNKEAPINLITVIDKREAAHGAVSHLKPEEAG